MSSFVNVGTVTNESNLFFHYIFSDTQNLFWIIHYWIIVLYDFNVPFKYNDSKGNGI